MTKIDNQNSIWDKKKWDKYVVQVYAKKVAS